MSRGHYFRRRTRTAAVPQAALNSHISERTKCCIETGYIRPTPDGFVHRRHIECRPARLNSRCWSCIGVRLKRRFCGVDAIIGGTRELVIPSRDQHSVGSHLPTFICFLKTSLLSVRMSGALSRSHRAGPSCVRPVHVLSGPGRAINEPFIGKGVITGSMCTTEDSNAAVQTAEKV